MKGSSLTLWSTTSWAIERTWTLEGTGQALAFAPRDSRLAVASNGEAGIWDPGTGRKLVTLSPPGSAQMTEIAWSPDARRIVTAADDGVLRFWSSSDGRLLASLYVIRSTDDWLLVAADGRFDGSANAVGSLVAWRTGERVSLDARLAQRRRTPGLWRVIATVTPR